jgi:hypothetical protein
MEFDHPRESDTARREQNRSRSEATTVFTVFARGIRLLDTMYEDDALQKARAHRGVVMQGTRVVQRFGHTR